MADIVSEQPAPLARPKPEPSVSRHKFAVAYLALAAMIAAGLHGIDNELELEPAFEGNAYESDADRFPSTMREAIVALEEGGMARGAFGDQVVDHYLNYARTEQGLYDAFVTDWERKRYFERG